MRSARRWLVLLAVLALAAAVVRALRGRRAAAVEPSGLPQWPPFDDPSGPRTFRPAEAGETSAVPERDASVRWVAPVERACPEGFPVKVKLGSGVYHLPGGALYERAVPDRCYAMADDAEADGFRPSKR